MSQPPNTMSSRSASGTVSLIFGDRPSVRLPRRIVPICVSEPMGFASPLRMARTPAIVVVLTAPRPTSRMPNLPFAGAISSFFTAGNYITSARLGCARMWARGVDRRDLRDLPFPRGLVQTATTTETRAGDRDDRRQARRSLAADSDALTGRYWQRLGRKWG